MPATDRFSVAADAELLARPATASGGARLSLRLTSRGQRLIHNEGVAKAISYVNTPFVRTPAGVAQGPAPLGTNSGQRVVQVQHLHG